MKRFLLLSTALALVAAFAFAGGKAEPAGQKAQSAALTKIKVSHHPYLHALPTYIAQQKGWYKEAGLDETVTMYGGGPPQNEALASDAWEVGTTGGPGAVFGGVGYGLRIIGYASASDTPTTDLWVRKDSPIAKAKGVNPKYPNLYGKAEDWKGKTILCPTATSCHFTLIATLTTMGLTDKDVKIMDIPVAQAYQAFKTGQGDIVAQWSPFGFLAEKEGWVKVSSAKDVNVELPTLIIASEKAIKGRPEVVSRWLELYYRGMAEQAKDVNQSAKWLFDFSKQEGIKISEEDAVKEVSYRKAPDFARQVQMFKKEGGQMSRDGKDHVHPHRLFRGPRPPETRGQAETHRQQLGRRQLHRGPRKEEMITVR